MSLHQRFKSFTFLHHIASSTLIMKLPHTEVKFYPEFKSQTSLSSLRVSCKGLTSGLFLLYMTIRPKLGVTLTLKFIIFLIVPIFCLQYCLHISSATIIPVYFVRYIHGYMKSATLDADPFQWVISENFILGRTH